MPNLRKQYLEASETIRKRIKVPLQVRKDKNKLESWLIQIESDLSEIQYKIEEAKGKEDFDADKILDLVDELNLKERRQGQGEALLNEMFNDDTPIMKDLQED